MKKAVVTFSHHLHHALSVRAVKLCLLCSVSVVSLGLAAGTGYFIALQQAPDVTAKAVLPDHTDNEAFAALATRVAELQARLVRLDALGERLVNKASLDTVEFDFGKTPSVGGPYLPGWSVMGPNGQLKLHVDHLADQVEVHSEQLSLIDQLLLTSEVDDTFIPSVKPVSKGHLTSKYGYRYDPIKGNVKWHNGVDYAAPTGTDILSVAAGVVVYSGWRNGYGNTVEILHADGVITRYAHNKQNIVSVGDVIEKGQVIARLGSSGRVTGPHLHFEVHRAGKSINPSTYLRKRG